MNNNHSKMLALYNDLDELLRSQYNDHNMSTSVMMKFIKDLSNSGYKEYVEMGKKLNMIRIIRNDLIHDLDMNRYSLIEISDETISFLEDLIKLIKHPEIVLDRCTKYTDLLKITPDNLDDILSELIIKMREQGHTQVPVVNANRAVVGVITPNVVFDYLAHKGNVEIDKLKVNDLKDYYKVDAHFSESYRFISSSTPVVDAGTIFAKALEQREKLACLFVTRTGQVDEPLLGIIVLSDIMKD